MLSTILLVLTTAQPTQPAQIPVTKPYTVEPFRGASGPTRASAPAKPIAPVVEASAPTPKPLIAVNPYWSQVFCPVSWPIGAPAQPPPPNSRPERAPRRNQSRRSSWLKRPSRGPTRSTRPTYGYPRDTRRTCSNSSTRTTGETTSRPFSLTHRSNKIGSLTRCSTEDDSRRRSRARRLQVGQQCRWFFRFGKKRRLHPAH